MAQNFSNSDSARYSGSVKWFNPTKGYGFIAPDNNANNGNDVFLHITALEPAGLTSINEGTKINFNLSSGNGGKISAVNIEIIR